MTSLEQRIKNIFNNPLNLGLIFFICQEIFNTYSFPYFTHEPYSFEFYKCFFSYLYISYFGTCFIYFVIDRTKSFALFKRQKEYCSLETYLKTFLKVGIYYTFIVIPTVYLFCECLKYRNLYYNKIEVFQNETFQIAFEDFLSLIILDTIAYFVHKYMHVNRWVWKHVHSHHHEWTTPIAVATLDAHPFEILAWDLGPILIGPIIIGFSAQHLMSYLIFLLSLNCTFHSGYNLWPAICEHHDIHHNKINCNFSFLLDHFMGTYKDH